MNIFLIDSEYTITYCYTLAEGRTRDTGVVETEAGRETVSGPAGDCVVSGIVVTGHLALKFSVVKGLSSG